MDRDDFEMDMELEDALATSIDEEIDVDGAVLEPPMLAEGSVDMAIDPAIPATSRKVRRRGRRTRMRSKTIAMKRLTKEEMRIGALMYPPMDEPRPQTRAECKEGQRPCPWVSCKHHLYLDVNPETGSIKLNFPDLEVWEMKDTCSLDVADRNGITLEEVGEIMNLTRERIRQVEVRGLLKLKTLTDFGADD
jgi:sigma-70-like protein